MSGYASVFLARPADQTTYRYRKGLAITPLAILTPLVAQIAAHAPPQPVGMPVRVDAAPKTAYVAKCHIRTFKGPLGLYANTFYIDAKGPFADRIPSPNAQCVFTKTAGEGPVILHIVKDGDHAARVDRAGQWVRLNVW